jgi:hypothetical protein
MKRMILALGLLGLWLLVLPAGPRAQTPDLPKFEVAAEFSSITKSNFDGARTEAGLGGRLTFNINKSFALEAAVYYFPHSCHTCDRTNGDTREGLFGVKAGKRFEKWGIFAKARPGFARFSQGDFNYVPAPPGVEVIINSATHFALDVGGVIEFYPTKKIVTRFDGGDTMIRFNRRLINFPVFDGTGNISFFPYTLPATTRHNFQFSAGVGFRF